MAKEIKAIFRNRGVKVTAPIRGAEAGRIEDYSRSDKAIRIKGTWYYKYNRTVCRKIKRFEGIWKYYGDTFRFETLKKGDIVRFTFLRYAERGKTRSYLVGLGILEPDKAPVSAEKAVEDIYGENISKAEIFAGEPKEL